MRLRGFQMAGEAVVPDVHARAGPGSFGSTGMQGVDCFGIKFPANHRLQLRAVAGKPGMDQQAGRIDFDIFSFDVEGFAVSAHAVRAPFAAYAQVDCGLGYMIETVLSPPARKLGRIADCLKYARGRCGNENFGNDGIVIGCNARCSHFGFLCEHFCYDLRRRSKSSLCSLPWSVKTHSSLW